VLVFGVLGAAVVLGLGAAFVTRRRTHEDEHSVEGYHRQIHTLEAMRNPSGGSGAEPVPGDLNGDAPPPAPPGDGAAKTPVRSVRLAGPSTVRVMGAGRTPPPPVAPPDVATAGKVTFDDALPPAPVASAKSIRNQSKAMEAMNRRPRRLAAPTLAVVCVVALIAVLLVIGSHKKPPRPHHGSTTAASHTGTAARHRRHASTDSTSTTTTTAPPAVSLPDATSSNSAVYKVADSSFTLTLSATTGACWVDVTGGPTDASLFEGVLSAGETHTVAATVPVTLEVGAPSAFSGSVDGTDVVLPEGYQTPFTLQFVPATSTAGSTGAAPTTTTTTSTTVAGG